MTPHIRAEKGDFAGTVLMPGDPLRAKFIAETFLEESRGLTSWVAEAAKRIWEQRRGG